MSSTNRPSPAPQRPTQGIESFEDRIARLFVGPQGIRAAWRWLIFVGIFFGCAGVFILVAVVAHIIHVPGTRPSAQSFTASSALIQEAILLLAMFVAALAMSKIEGRPMGQYGLPARQAFGRQFWAGTVWGILAITATMLLITVLHGFTFDSVALAGSALAGYALIWAIAFLLTGFSEEFLFRGYSQFTLTTGMGFWPAAIFLSLLFGASHLQNAGEAWPGALAAAYIGFFFCFTLRRTGTIWFAVGLHAAWDYGETFVYGVPDSGFVAPGHLLNTSLHGPVWLTGGKVGPEASIACFIVISLLFVAFHFAYPSRAKAFSGS
ncbi:MAG TPA: CPBP family intramembrane glutamic endopeptidase [Candidatus Acidoferrales bacterium]|nr:CPBP family intramembrane glutamic endopeptidase [Candidatus Acidoferrales bacterium]